MEQTNGASDSAATRRPTIRDVARAAGVSIKTVSNVNNGKGSMRQETRDRVERAMQDLGYSLNVSARSLKTGSSGLIGLAVFGFAQPFASMLAQRVITQARRRGYNVVIDTYEGGESGGFTGIMEETRFLPADGWIYFAAQPIADAMLAGGRSVPFVIAGDWLAHGRADVVTMPNVDAARVATGKLLDQGRRRIALLGAPAGEPDLQTLRSATEGTSDLRAKGYAQAFTDRGLEVPWDLLLPVEDLTYQCGADAIAPLSGGQDAGGHDAGPPTGPAEDVDAIVCLNDALALGAVHALVGAGRRVPEDVSVIGFDNIPEGGFFTPELTTIDPHMDDYARAAVDMLMERIEGYTGPARTYTTDFDLVVRRSALV
jgi:DNA-binding LacI/PurR family transcriptional regulator